MSGEQGSIDLQKLHACLEGIPEVSFAYLFGSWAAGRPQEESDVDLAVHLRHPATDDPAAILRRLIPALSPAVASPHLDLVLLNQAPLLLKHQVLEEGRLVFCRDRSVWAEFFVRTCDDFADWLPMLAPHVRATRERILEGKGFGQPGDPERSLARARELLG